MSDITKEQIAALVNLQQIEIDAPCQQRPLSAIRLDDGDPTRHVLGGCDAATRTTGEGARY